MGWSTCCACKAQMWIPDALEEAAKRSRGPNGMRRERDRLKQQIAWKDDEIKGLEARRRAAVGQVTKLRKRVGNGVCPCCTRSFTNLQRHMETEHPEWRAEAAE